MSKDHKIGFPSIEYVMTYTGYLHGANTPIGIHKKHLDYLFLVDNTLKKQHELSCRIVKSPETSKLLEKTLKQSSIQSMQI